MSEQKIADRLYVDEQNLSCVYLTTYSGQLMPPFYIGSTFLKKIKKGYRGSVLSKKWKDIWRQEIKEHPELFDTRILSLHKTRKEAYKAEEYYHRKESVIHNNLYINECIANGGFSCTGHAEETKKKIGKAGKGRKCTEETKQKMKGPKSAEARKNMSISKRKADRKRKEQGRNFRDKRDQEVKTRISNKLLGHDVSEETRRKLRSIFTGRARNRKVRCVELDIIFSSLREASRYVDCWIGGVGEAASGKTETVGRYHWEYVE